MLFISCGDLPHSAVSCAYRTFEIDLPPITAPDYVIPASLITCSVLAHKSSGDRMHPCRTPFYMKKGLVCDPFQRTIGDCFS